MVIRKITNVTAGRNVQNVAKNRENQCKDLFIVLVPHVAGQRADKNLLQRLERRCFCVRGCLQNAIV